MLALCGLVAWRVHQRSLPLAVVRQQEQAPRAVQWFTLTERSGRPLTLDDLRGHVWIASFFFSNCPGVCVKLNQTLAQLQRDLPDDVWLVSITVDPEHDTPQRLQEYAARFGADPQRWFFLTGPMDQIKQIAQKSFLVSAAPGVHSDRLTIVDRHGRLRGSYRGADEAQVRALRRKLAEVAKEETTFIGGVHRGKERS